MGPRRGFTTVTLTDNYDQHPGRVLLAQETISAVIISPLVACPVELIFWYSEVVTAFSTIPKK